MQTPPDGRLHSVSQLLGRRYCIVRGASRLGSTDDPQAGHQRAGRVQPGYADSNKGL